MPFHAAFDFINQSAAHCCLLQGLDGVFKLDDNVVFCIGLGYLHFYSDTAGFFGALVSSHVD